MQEYTISGKCPHCGGLTLLERMTETRLRRTEPALASILHTLICGHCSERFGTGRGKLVKEKRSN